MAPRLLSLATAVPRHVLHQHEIVERARRIFADSKSAAIETMLGVYGNAGIETRYSCVHPDWYEASHGWAEKNRLYLENALTLSVKASEAALAEAGLNPENIDCLITVSTTGIATPSIDAMVMDALPFRCNVERLPIFGLGCAGGVIGLARAASMARLAPGRRVLLIVVELCGLTFRRGDSSKSNIVAAALFGDGAAAAVIGNDDNGVGEPAITASGEHTWRGSLDIMGWSVEDDGLGVLFSRDIPNLTRTAFRAAALDYLAPQGQSFCDIDEFVCHPGGAKVLDALEEAFGLGRGSLAASRAVLRDYGNMSAVTVLFVLRRILDADRKGRWLLSALGPGFTAAFLTLDAR